MAKELIGYGYTNANGVATMDYDAEDNPLSPSGYQGIGAGLVDISAETVIDGVTVESTTYEIFDGIFLDKAITGSKSNYWLYQSNWGVTPSPNGTTITEDNSGSPLMVASVENATSWSQAKTFTTPIAVELDVDNIENYPRFIIYYNGDANNEKPVFEQSGHYKFTIDSNGIYRSINGGTPTQISGASITGTVKVGFSDTATSSQGSLRYKNFVVYPIYSPLTSITLSATKQTIQSGETATLTATLDNHQIGRTVKLYNGSTFVANMTDNGDGTYSYTYTGVGDGNVEFTALCGNIQATYSLIDAVFNDKVPSDTTSLYYLNTTYSSIAYSDGKIIISALNNVNAPYVDVRSLVNTVKGKSVRFSCDVEPNNCEVRLEVYGTAGAGRTTEWVSSATHLETEPYTIPSNTSTGFFRIMMRNNDTGSSFAFKNFTVWFED